MLEARRSRSAKSFGCVSFGWIGVWSAAASMACASPAYPGLGSIARLAFFPWRRRPNHPAASRADPENEGDFNEMASGEQNHFGMETTDALFVDPFNVRSTQIGNAKTQRPQRTQKFGTMIFPSAFFAFLAPLR